MFGVVDVGGRKRRRRIGWKQGGHLIACLNLM